MRRFVANQRRFHGLIVSLVPNLADPDDLLQDVLTLMWDELDRCSRAPTSRRRVRGCAFCRKRHVGGVMPVEVPEAVIAKGGEPTGRAA